MKDRFDGTSIIELSEGNNLGNNDGFFDDFSWVDYIAQG